MKTNYKFNHLSRSSHKTKDLLNVELKYVIKNRQQLKNKNFISQNFNTN